MGKVMISLLPPEVQHQIISKIEAEQKLVEANRELIERMEAKIQVKLAEI